MMRMITSVCLNPCIDKTARVERFLYGGMNRVTHSRLDGSGKGVNVAVSLRLLGADAACIGFIYRDNGRLITDKLEQYGAAHGFLTYDGAVRINLKVLDDSRQVITEINEAGVAANEAQLSAFKDVVRDYASRSDYMVFTGSLPPACPSSFYRTLIELVGDRCRCVLDAEGETLRTGIEAKPYIIKPNLYELETITGGELATQRDILNAALSFIEQGIGIVMVSLGADGALITDGTTSLYAPVLPVAVQSTVGAGDSMLAGLLKGLEDGADVEAAFRRAVAAATAGVMTEGTQPLEIETYKELLGKVVIEAL